MRKHNPILIPLAVMAAAMMGCLCGGTPAFLIGPERVEATPTTAATRPALTGDQPFTIVRVRVSDGALPDLLKAEVEKARALDQDAFVEFYADWCPPCNAIRDTLDQGDPLMVDAFAGTYIIQLDLDEWANDLEGTGLEGVSGIPAYYALDEDGKPTGQTITGAAWGDNIPENMAPPLKGFFEENPN